MRLLRLTPWRRGPALLARRPGVALALAAAALVAALPTAAAPLFLSSAQHATLHRQIDETCPWLVGGQFTGPIAPANPLSFRSRLGPDSIVGADRYRQRLAAIAAEPIPGLSTPASAGYGDLNAVPADRSLPLPDLSGIRLTTRDDFARHVEVLAGSDGPGLWLPHEHAQRQGLAVGDELVLRPRAGDPGTWTPPPVSNQVVRPFQPPPEIPMPDPEPVTVPVAAIYRDLRTLPAADYWCGVADGYLGTQAERNDPNVSILPMVLVDTETFLRIGETTRMPAHQWVEFAPTDPHLTAPAAAALAAEVESLRRGMFQDYPELFPTDGPSDQTEFSSALDRYQRRAALVRTGLLPPVLPITAAGTLVGLAVAAAAAVFWAQRRRQELRVLAAHGVSPRGLGLKAVIEALPAVAAGTAAGWGAAWLLVASVGPSPVLAAGTLPLAGFAAGAVALVALVLIGTIAASATRTLVDARPSSRGTAWWRRVPWELALLAAAPAAWLLLSADQVIDAEAGGVGTVAHVPARLLATPILAIVGLAVLTGRLTTSWLHRRGLARTPASTARLLAWRRSVRAAAATAILAIATAVPVAMAAYGATATDSIRTTADAKLQFRLGSDTVITYPRGAEQELDGLPPPPPVPDALAGRTAEVLRINQQRLDGLIVDVLAVDPATFPAGAFWDDRIPDDNLQDAVARLTTDSPATIVASRRIAPGPAVLTIRDTELLVEVAATRELPGAQSAYPLVLVHRGLVDGLTDRVRDSLTPQWWIAGEPTETLATVAAAELPVTRVASIDDHRVGAVYEPITYTFQYLLGLSIFTGLIGAVGLLLYLESRTTAHRRAYVILRRLGLPAPAHRRALLLEICLPVGIGLIAGLGLAVTAAFALRSGFDVNPERFPSALLDLPATITLLISAATVTLAIGASVLAHARISRADPSEVLRDTA
jgi:putative ABC transport system permease protein